MLKNIRMTKQMYTHYIFQVVCEENCDLKTPSVGTKLVPNFSLHLYPPLVFHNLLPLVLDIHIKVSTLIFLNKAIITEQLLFVHFSNLPTFDALVLKAGFDLFFEKNEKKS